jgi:hypothetical protein
MLSEFFLGELPNRVLEDKLAELKLKAFDFAFMCVEKRNFFMYI